MTWIFKNLADQTLSKPERNALLQRIKRTERRLLRKFPDIGKRFTVTVEWNSNEPVASSCLHTDGSMCRDELCVIYYFASSDKPGHFGFHRVEEFDEDGKVFAVGTGLPLAEAPDAVLGYVRGPNFDDFVREIESAFCGALFIDTQYCEGCSGDPEPNSPT